MNTNINVSRRAIHYILLQRTGYQTPLLAKLLRHLPSCPGHFLVSLEAFIRNQYIVSRFQSGILGDFNSIKDSLPGNASLILDIGCGVAGIDVLLSRHYSQPQPPQIYLSDYEETSSVIKYDFSRSPAKYNSLKIAKTLLVQNAVPKETIRLIDPNKLSSLSHNLSFDLVISILAWGFHFPVTEYLDTVYELLSDTGVLILDVRQSTTGIKELQSKFQNVKILVEDEVKARVLAIK